MRASEPVGVSAAPCLCGGGTASGCSAAPLASDWTSSATGCLLEGEQVVGLGCAALFCVFDPFWCARPPDFDLPLGALPLLFLLMTRRKAELGKLLDQWKESKKESKELEQQQVDGVFWLER